MTPTIKVVAGVMVAIVILFLFPFPSLSNIYADRNSGDSSAPRLHAISSEINSLSTSVKEMQKALKQITESQEYNKDAISELSSSLNSAPVACASEEHVKGLSKDINSLSDSIKSTQGNTNSKIDGLSSTLSAVSSKVDTIGSTKQTTNDNEVIAEYSQNLVTLSKHFKNIRKEVGKLRCEKAEKGIGGTGGFCLWGKKPFEGAGGNDMFDHPLAVAIEELLTGKEVYDMGCGVGRYGAFWTRNKGVPASIPFNDVKDGDGPMKIKSWKGVDGSEGIEENTENWVEFLDLTVPAWMPVRDWVVSLEVGEHIPREVMWPYLENMDRHNTEGIVLSWAVKGQKGFFHVNTMDNSEVIELMKTVGNGYTYDEKTSLHLKETATLWWFQDTVMVFRKN